MCPVSSFADSRILDRILGSIRSRSATVTGPLSVFTLVFLAACGGDKPTEPDPVDPREPEPPTVATVEVSPKTAALSALGAEQAFTATAKDASGEEIEDVVVQWHSSDPSVATLDAEGTATAKAAGESTITATVDGVQAHAELTVTQTAAAVRFRSSPEDGVAGAALEPVLQVEILDEDGSVVSGATDAVTIALGSAPSGAELTGSRTANAVNGIATFSGLMIERAAKDYTLVASAGGIDPDTSSTFEIAPGPAAVLALTREPDDVVAGDTLSALEVRVEDAYGNLIEDAELEVEVAIGSGPSGSSGATLGGTTLLDTEAGVAVFDDLVLDHAGERYSLRVSTPGLGAAETERFSVAAGPAVRLRFASVPGRANAHEPFEVGVAVEDAYGNLVEGDSVDFGLGESPRESAVLGDVTHVRTRDGVIIYETMIDRPGKGFTLRASVDGPGMVESAPFDVGLEIAQFAAGHEFACALTTAKHAFCWGSPTSQFGQLGDGEEESSLLPVPVSGGHTFERIAAGGWHACGLTEDGEAYCWGYNDSGRLGDGTTDDRSGPVAVVGGHRFREIMAGQWPTCGRTDTSDVYCWGSNTHGQLGNGDGGDFKLETEPAQVVGGHDFVALASEGGSTGSAGHICAITDEGETYCWGRNIYGQLGYGNWSNNGIDEPMLVSGDHSFITVTVGGSHTCALTEAGEAYCWGQNNSGQLGDGGARTEENDPVAVAGNHTFVAITADRNSTCALTESGEAYCWGENDEGQLGDGSQGNHDEPTQVVGGHTFTSIVLGTYFTCAVTPDHELYCWGENASGQYGNGTTDGSLTPVRVEY